MSDEDVKEMFELYRIQAKQNYLECREAYETLNGITNVVMKLQKFQCIMDGGIYNNNKKMYQRGYGLVIKEMYKIIENYDPETCSALDIHDSQLLTKNEAGYLKVCNHYKETKEILDRRHNFLMKYNYFPKLDANVTIVEQYPFYIHD